MCTTRKICRRCRRMELGFVATIAGAAATLMAALVTLFKVRDELLKIRAERHKIESEREQIETCASDQITRTALSLIEPLEQRVVVLEAEKARLQDVVDKQGEKIAALQCENTQLQRDVAAGRDENTRLSNEIGNLQRQNDVLTSSLNLQGEEISELKTDNARLLEGVGLLTRQVEALGQRPVYQAQPMRKR